MPSAVDFWTFEDVEAPELDVVGALGVEDEVGFAVVLVAVPPGDPLGALEEALTAPASEETVLDELEPVAPEGDATRPGAPGEAPWFPGPSAGPSAGPFSAASPAPSPG